MDAEENGTTTALRIEREERGAVVRILAAEVTMFVLPDIRLALSDLVQEKPARIVLDFAETAFLDSSGLAMIFRLRQEVEAYGGAVYIAGIKSSLRKVLTAVLQKGEILCFDTVEAALAAAS